MNNGKTIVVASLGAAFALGACSMFEPADKNPMTFFITSAAPGNGDLGGLAGADKICKNLATSVGAGNKNWRAYLSVSASGASPPVNARDRIGSGPWQNAKGVVVAHNLDELHGTNNLGKQTSLSEKGEVINGRGDTPNTHDMLTGSQADGTAFAPGKDTTCGNWTSSSEGSAFVGHHDRIGINETAPQKSWGSSHATPGCTTDALKRVGGGGLFYCFAAK